jgi:serine/threonine-protein kinase
VSESNRDLLVAVLALLTDPNPPPGLAAALNAWSHDRQQPLAQLLEKAAALDDEHLRAVARLAAAQLQTQPDDLVASPVASPAEELTQDVATEISTHDLGMTLDTTSGNVSTVPMEQGSVGVSGSPGSSGAFPAGTRERFELIRPHASGGIGQVWVARDSELQRDVALKEIQPRFAEREDQRARFVLEAEITGNLEHPGIVPVYSLGRNAQGRPYYAMRFIRGESFQVAIRRFHERLRDLAGKAGTSSWSPSKWGIEFRQLIGRFLDVCDAIDYAHSRGVLHRDLKPANIMLGHYGETLVVDWGLAKVIGKDDIVHVGTDGENEPGLSAKSETLSGGTEQGTTIGTPAYMSPEQARGSIDQLGPASDVYSLGASLFELLTGRTAFHEKKLSEVIEKVLAGDFPPPRALDRSIPAPLEAICLKAMAKEPAGRYTSVRALAQDIEHWLADEPVAAYPERRLERTGRWIRRHRTWAYAAAAALVGISTVATIAAVVIEGARRSEAIVRKEAETNFDVAQKAVEDYLTNVSENTLLKEQDSVDNRSLRQDLLRTALEYYQRFAAERRDDPRLRKQLAKAYFRVGQITREIGSHQQAMEAFRSAQSILKPMVTDAPEEHELERYLAECELGIGRLQSAAGNLHEAMGSLSQARAILDRLAGKYPLETRFQTIQAECYQEIAIIQAKIGQADQGLVLLGKARGIQEALINQHPDNLDFRKSLAEIINVIGFAQFMHQDNASALRSFEQVQGICETILKQVTLGPKPIWLLNLLSLSQKNIASIHQQNGELEKALKSLEQSLESRSALADAHPSVSQFQVKLAMSYRHIAEVQHTAHQDDKAFRSIQKSIDVFEGLVRAHPEQASYHSEFGLSLNFLGVLYDNCQKHVEAIQPLKRSVAEQQLAVEMSEETDEFKKYLCNHLDNLGLQYIGLGRVADAVAEYRSALLIRRRLSSAHPKNREYVVEVAKDLIAIGAISRRDGEPAAAVQSSFSEARTLVESALSSAPDDPALQEQLASALQSEASTLADQAKFSDAKTFLERAVDLFRLGLSHASTEVTRTPAREALNDALWDLARVLRAQDLQVKAEQADTERMDLWKGRPPGELVTLALKQTRRAVAIGHGKTDISAPAKAIRELDLQQAASELNSAILLGFKDLPSVKADPDSVFLLRRKDLESSISVLESKDRQSGPPKP